MQIKSDTIKQIGAGDKEAFSHLFDQLAPTIYGLSLRITESRSKAESVVIEVFRQIWRQAPSYDSSQHNPFYWVIGIAKNIALANESRSEQFDFFAYQESNMANHSLKDLLSQIDDKHRKVLELSFFRNLEEEQIEEEMNIPVGTVSNRLRLAIKAMRQILG